MNRLLRLLMPTVALSALLIAGCENWDSPDWQKNTSDQSTAPDTAPDQGTAPAAPDPSGSTGSMQ